MCEHLTGSKTGINSINWSNFGQTVWLNKIIFYAPQLYRQVLLRRVLAMEILSVRMSVRPSRPGAETTEWDRDSGSSPYDSLESLASNEVILVPLGEEIPLERGHQRGVPPLEIVILPLLALLAWKRLQIDTDFLPTITSTADKLSSGTNINDLERPWTPKIGVFSNFLAILGCITQFKSELRRNHSRWTRTTCTWNVCH